MKAFTTRSLESLTRSGALLLCGLLASSAIGCGPAEEGDGAGGPATPRTSVPASIAAEWYAGNISSAGFYNPSTGAWGAPSGPGMYFRFTADGTYEKGVLLQSSLYGCTMTFLAYNRGTMTVAGDRIGLYPTYGRIKSIDSCVAANNYEKPDQLAAETLVWELGLDEYGSRTLWLRYENGSPSAFHSR